MQDKKAGLASDGKDASPASRGSSAKDKVHYIEDALYARLKAAATGSATRSRPGEFDRTALDAVEAYLIWEARLLDLGRYREWVDLFTEDCVYWVPSNADHPDPVAQAAINFDDRRRLIDRISLIETGDQIAQIPRSRTCRTLSNIEGWRSSDGFEIRSNTVIWEYRRGRMSTFAGSQTHHLVAEGAGHFRIRWKIINLINADQPQGNITFIL